MQPLVNRLGCHPDGLSELSSVANGFAGLLDGRFVHAGIVKQYFPPVSSIASTRSALLNQAMPSKRKPRTDGSPPQLWLGQRLQKEREAMGITPSAFARLCEERRTPEIEQKEAVSRQGVNSWETTGRVAKQWLLVFAQIFRTSHRYWLSESATRDSTHVLSSDEYELLGLCARLTADQRKKLLEDLQATADANLEHYRQLSPLFEPQGDALDASVVSEHTDPLKPTERTLPSAALTKNPPLTSL